RCASHRAFTIQIAALDCHVILRPPSPSLFFFHDTATTEFYTLSLHDALPISVVDRRDRATVIFLDAAARQHPGAARAGQALAHEIGRAHVLTPVTWPSRMPSSA